MWRRSHSAIGWPLFVLGVVLLGPQEAYGESRSHLQHFERGYRGLYEQRFNEAAYWFARAVELRPEIGGPRLNLSGLNYVYYLPYYSQGIAHFGAGQFGRADEAWQTAEAKWQDQGELWESLTKYRQSVREFRAFVARVEEVERLLADAWEGRAGDSVSGRGTRTILRAADAELSLAIRRSRQLWRLERLRQLRRLSNRLAELANRLREVDQLGDDVSVRRIDWAVKFRTWLTDTLLPTGSVLLLDSSRKRDEFASRDTVFLPAEIERIQRAYEKRTALLISPATYENYPALEAVSCRFQRLEEALRGAGFNVKRSGQGETRDQLFRKILEFVEDGTKPHLGRNLILLVFVGHSCELQTRDGLIVLLPTSGAPACATAHEGPEAQGELIRSSIMARDLHNLTERPDHHLFVMLEGCSTQGFLDNLEPYGRQEWRPSVENPALVFVGTGATGETVDADLKATLHLARALEGCDEFAGEGVHHGYDIFWFIETMVRPTSVHKARWTRGRHRWRLGDMVLTSAASGCRDRLYESGSRPHECRGLGSP